MSFNKNFLFVLFAGIFSCDGRREVRPFDDYSLLVTIKGTRYCPDPTYSFIQYLDSGRLDMCEELFPDIVTMDVSAHIVKVEGVEYLNSLGEFLRPHIESSNKLLIAAIWLKRKYAVKKVLYDKMLRACLQLDSNNYLALYFLSKLRFEEGFVGDSKYLLKLLMSLDKTNQVVSLTFQSVEGPVESYRNLDEFLGKEVYYLNP